MAQKLVDEVFYRFSPLEQLHSDQGRQFELLLVAEVCLLLGIQKMRMTAYHSQSDRLVERWNRTLLHSLSTCEGTPRELGRPCKTYLYGLQH